MPWVRLLSPPSAVVVGSIRNPYKTVPPSYSLTLIVGVGRVGGVMEALRSKGAHGLCEQRRKCDCSLSRSHGVYTALMVVSVVNPLLG